MRPSVVVNGRVIRKLAIDRWPWPPQCLDQALWMDGWIIEVYSIERAASHATTGTGTRDQSCCRVRFIYKYENVLVMLTLSFLFNNRLFIVFSWLTGKVCESNVMHTYAKLAWWE